jgi:DNA-directed RNA polymerase subunit M/transcription elongation factor TFIIS
MEFCPECASILKPEKVETEEGITVMLVCSKCGYKKPMASRRIKPKATSVIKHDIKQRVTIIGKEEQKINTLPTIKVECPSANTRRRRILNTILPLHKMQPHLQRIHLNHNNFHKSRCALM